jgi:TRAP transporter TAXI family solute receptor
MRGGLEIDREALKALAVSVGPAVLLAALAVAVACTYVQPAPPRTFRMSTGAEDGAYHLFAQQYRTILARQGVRVELRPSAGAVENLSRLLSPDGNIDVGFVQAGITPPADAAKLVSLGAMYYEPLWIFYRGERRLERITSLAHRRVAVGAEGSGTRALALPLLDVSGAAGATVRTLGGAEALAALRQGRVDAAFFVAAPDAPLVQQLVHARDLRLMSIVNAEAYARRFPLLTPVVVPRGVFDLARDIPAENVTLLAATADLVTRADFHPALASLLLQAATEVHGGPGMLQRPREFPAPREAGFPLSTEAQRYYRSGKPFLQRFLPFWVANFIERMIVLVLPLVAVLVPAVKIVPAIYRWRVRSRILRWYGELQRLEADVARGPDAATAVMYAQHLHEIERGANATRVPTGFTHELYSLREHLALVRADLQRAEQARARMSGESPPNASRAGQATPSRRWVRQRAAERRP